MQTTNFTDHNIPESLYKFFPAIKTDKEYSPEIYAWFLVMTAVSFMNIAVWIYMWANRHVTTTQRISVKNDRDLVEEVLFTRFEHTLLNRPTDTDHKTVLLALASTFVVQCAWRSFFPAIYNERIAYWDTDLNSVFIGRALATIGEVGWIIQVGICTIRCQRELKIVLNQPKYNMMDHYVYMACYASIVMCFTAEFFCNNAMATLNYLHNVIETVLWTISLALVTPCGFYLYFKANEVKDKMYDTTQIKYLAVMLSTVGICFVVQLIVDHIPLQYRGYLDALENGRTYLPIYEGYVSSIKHRITSKSWVDWQYDWFWMLAYFTTGVWSSLFMATAPGLMIRAQNKAIYNKKVVSAKKVM